MKGVILAGGLGSRLHPLTKATNKHLLPVGSEPMLYHPIRQMVSSDIEDILVVTSTQHMGDVVRCLGSGEEFGCRLSYKVQEHAGGHRTRLLQWLKILQTAIKFALSLATTSSSTALSHILMLSEDRVKGAHVLIKEVGDPERYGVAALDEHQVIEIEEKPSNPKSSFAVIGLYYYDSQVFDIIRTIDVSKRGEMEITTVNNVYIEKKQLHYSICTGRWTDAGTFESLFEANQIMMNNHNRLKNNE